MAKHRAVPEPEPRRIIVEQRFGDWQAWFTDHPESAFGGDSPGTAVDRLWGNHLENAEAAAGAPISPSHCSLGGRLAS